MFIENRINETKKFVFIHDRQSKGKKKILRNQVFPRIKAGKKNNFAEARNSKKA